MIDYQNVFNTIHTNLNNDVHKGLVASCIYELAKIDVQNFGIHLELLGGQTFVVGDWNKKLSLQSIPKVLTLARTLSIYPENLGQRLVQA